MFDAGDIEYSEYVANERREEANRCMRLLTHAHQDAQRTGHCHWCVMQPVVKEHLITGYTHADDCELTKEME